MENTISRNGWSRTFSWPVRKILEVSDKLLVLLDPKSHEDEPRNLLCLNSLDGTTVWQIEEVRLRPTDVRCFLDIQIFEGRLLAYHGAPMEVEIDIETGRIVAQREAR